VPWFAQLDSATDQARRMCFSSSCAMLLAFIKPGVLSGPNGDDQYLARVHQFGDTTNPAGQIKALASYSITARFSNQASFSTLEEQIAAGIPVPCGYLHRGPISRPGGSGHWLIVVGITPSQLIVHDPCPLLPLQPPECCAALDGGRRGNGLGGVGAGVRDGPLSAWVWSTG